jgi:ferric-dicitrate binding protein FerR (iron transport regulator)
VLDFDEAGIRPRFESPWSEIRAMGSRLTSSRVLFRLFIAAAAFVSPVTVPAQDLGGAAKIVVMTGRVSVLKDGMEWARAMGDVVEPKQIIITGEDSYAKFQLADGSTFEVFQNTKTIFRDTPGWTDLLNVLIGRVKVYIEHRNGPNHQRVTTQTAVISVRGTVFDVVVEDEDATTLVSVEEGTVNVRHQRFGSSVELRTGESVRVFKNQNLAQSIDKGGAARVALRAAAQAVYDALYRRTIGGGSSSGGPSSGGGGTPSQGDPKGPTKGGSGGANGPNAGGPSGGGTAPPPPPPSGP